MKTAMTDEEKRIAIATFCGWRDAFPDQGGPHPLTKKGGILLPYKWVNERTGEKAPSLPNFLHSLDDMHAAEEKLTYDQRPYYILNLKKVMMSEAGVSDFDFAHATARQRAEAFLKTIQQP